MEYIIVSHDNPHLDDIASIYAYNEFINKLGFNSDYYILGNINKDILEICNKFNIKLKSIDKINVNANVILIGENDIEKISLNINKDNVTEIVNNKYKANLENIYKNANIQIENVSAISVIIASRFIEHHISLSNESLVLLYTAIMKCTKNLSLPIIYKEEMDVINYLKKKIRV